jgi:hypothetical protein
MDTLGRVVPEVGQAERMVLAKAIRRVLLAGLFDRSMTADDIGMDVRTLVETATRTSRSADLDPVAPARPS